MTEKTTNLNILSKENLNRSTIYTVKGKTGIHKVIIYKDKNMPEYCSCPGFYYKKKCKHLTYIKDHNFQ